MSFWEDHDVQRKIVEILSTAPGGQPHHFKRPFMSAYQVAIEFNNRDPKTVEALGFPLGGEGIGERNSFAQYIAGELSRRIAGGSLAEVEGAFLSNSHLEAVEFKGPEGTIRSSLTDTQFPLSMYRLKA